ncbi:MAG TPA: arginine--tRNA ligase [Acidimicrobiales bacterium]|nr:arginine--tRNA ligase [Acidimicrobiales bacterium]
MPLHVESEIAEALAAALATLGLEVAPRDIRLERPARPEHGDLSSNVALASAARAGRPPREIAAALAESLAAAGIEHLAGTEVAGPGFVNVRLLPSYLHESLRDVIAAGEDGYARELLGGGERVQVEFVSANPTGPLHVGNGWFASYGDALARILERCGYAVRREYYVNDTGGQVRLLGESLLARRRGGEVPDEGYQGAYVTELAERYEGPDDIAEAGRFAVGEILANIRATLGRFGIVFDEWYSQASVEESGQVAETIELLRSRGYVEERDGATWFRSSELGDSRDRVLVRANGVPTYLAGDLAYHRNKFLLRGYDRVIDVFGADHHGQVASLKAGVQALGIDPARLEVVLGQLVSISGQKMSKRAGNFVRLDDLVELVGRSLESSGRTVERPEEATRLLSLLYSIDQATTLDLDALGRQSPENPVYYVQYAYARISSIDRMRAARGVQRRPIGEVDLSLLEHPRELALIRCLTDLPGAVREAAQDRAPYKITNWVRRLASDFHGFYHDCTVLSSESVEVAPALTQARLWLAEGARICFAIGLSLLGVSAPEQM